MMNNKQKEQRELEYYVIDSIKQLIDPFFEQTGRLTHLLIPMTRAPSEQEVKTRTRSRVVGSSISTALDKKERGATYWISYS